MMRSIEAGFSPEDPEQWKESIASGLLLKGYGSARQHPGLNTIPASDDSRYGTGGVFSLDGGGSTGCAASTVIL